MKSKFEDKIMLAFRHQGKFIFSLICITKGIFSTVFTNGYFEEYKFEKWDLLY